MKNSVIVLLSVFCVGLFLLTTTTSASNLNSAQDMSVSGLPNASPPVRTGNASDWALQEVIKAYEMNIIPDLLSGGDADLTMPICKREIGHHIDNASAR